jgi:hypothetical protein
VAKYGNGCLTCCYGSSLDTNPDIAQKYKMDDVTISTGVANTAKKYIKKKKPWPWLNEYSKINYRGDRPCYVALSLQNTVKPRQDDQHGIHSV